MVNPGARAAQQSQRRETARPLCGTLNRRGGRVLFGIEAEGRMVGQDLSDHSLEEVIIAAGQMRPHSHRGQVYREATAHSGCFGCSFRLIPAYSWPIPGSFLVLGRRPA